MTNTKSTTQFSSLTDYELLWKDFEGESGEVRPVLWDRYQRLVFKHCNRFYGFCKNYMAYEDLVQECWIAFNTALDKNQPDRMTHRTFKFYTIFLWHIKKQFKKITRRLQKKLTHEWNFGDYVETFETFEEETVFSSSIPELMHISDERFEEGGTYEDRFRSFAESLSEEKRRVFYELSDGRYMTEISRQLSIPYSRVIRQAKEIRIEVTRAFPEAYGRFQASKAVGYKK